MTRCSCCGWPVRLSPFRTAGGPFVVHEGLCRRCLGYVPVELRRLLLDARRTFTARPGLEEAVQFGRAWMAVRTAATWRRRLAA